MKKVGEGDCVRQINKHKLSWYWDRVEDNEWRNWADLHKQKQNDEMTGTLCWMTKHCHYWTPGTGDQELGTRVPFPDSYRMILFNTETIQWSQFHSILIQSNVNLMKYSTTSETDHFTGPKLSFCQSRLREITPNLQESKRLFKSYLRPRNVRLEWYFGQSWEVVEWNYWKIWFCLKQKSLHQIQG